MNLERSNYITQFLAAIIFMMVVAQAAEPTLRQKGAEVLDWKQWEETLSDPAIPQPEITEPVDSEGSVLVTDPMDEGGPIPIDPLPTDTEVLVPPGANDPPVLVEELSTHISGPTDAMVGDMVKLHAIIRGKPTAIKWLISPEVDDFETLDGGMRAVFANRNVGVYHVVCSVAGNDGHVDVDTHTFEIVPQPPENPLTPNTISQLTPQLSVDELIKRWLAEVNTSNKVGEAHAIAGSFRSVASLLRSGTIPGPDLLRSVQEGSEVAVGPQAFKLWRGYFDRIREFLVPLNASRVVFTPEQYANTFENIATVMETLTAVEPR